MTAATEIQPYNRPSFNNGNTPVSQATAIEQQRAIAEVQAQVIVAQNCPRNMADAEAEMEYVCGRMDMAEQAFYQVTNRGTGPSVHLARELARIWGNIDYGVKELHRDDVQGNSEVLAFAWDMQKNSRSSRTFINPHQRMRQGARIDLTDLQDIYLSNQNIGARAVRETIFTIIPRWFTEKAQNICRRTLEHGEGKPLQERIASLVKAFEGLGVTEQQLEVRVDKKRGAWTPEDVAQLTVAGQSLRRGEAQKDELFPAVAEESSTADEIATPADEKPAEKPKRTRKTKAQKAREDIEAKTVEAAKKADAAEGIEYDGDAAALAAEAAEANADVVEPGQGGGNDQSQGAEPSSGATPPRDSGDQKKPARTPMRTALEKRLFALLKDANVTERDDRLDIYRAIVSGIEITSTNDLPDDAIAAIGDQLYRWKEAGELDVKVTDIINSAEQANEGSES